MFLHFNRKAVLLTEVFFFAFKLMVNRLTDSESCFHIGDSFCEETRVLPDVTPFVRGCDWRGFDASML